MPVLVDKDSLSAFTHLYTDTPTAPCCYGATATQPIQPQRLSGPQWGYSLTLVFVFIYSIYFVFTVYQLQGTRWTTRSDLVLACHCPWCPSSTFPRCPPPLLAQERGEYWMLMLVPPPGSERKAGPGRCCTRSGERRGGRGGWNRCKLWKAPGNGYENRAM